MKLSSINPIAMKDFHQPNFHFSAYPLKALNLPEGENKTYLRISRNGDGHIKYVESTKVFPMINPYKEKNSKPLVKNTNKNIQEDKVEERESEWFSNYE